MGEVIAGRFELEDVIGVGGMATVYRGRDLVLERTVALKELDARHAVDPGFVERFRDEARAAARLEHPNAVRVIDRLADGDREFIVFEYVEGETVADLVAREGPLPAGWVVDIGLGIAQALAGAHALGIVHRDVKPQNVLLGEDGRPRVADFGIARDFTADGRTEVGALAGTAAYLPPEAARGEPAGPEGDAYSLGCVLYELLAGTPPYAGDSFVVVALRHVEEPSPDVRLARPDCPERLAVLVGACLAKSPAERPTAAQVARELASLQAEEPELVAEPIDQTLVIPAAVRHGRSRRSRKPLLLVLLLVAAALVALVAVALLRGGGDEAAGGGAAVPVEAVGTYDPEGDGVERDDIVALATDGDPGTFWTTEGYDHFDVTKSGVGLVLDAGDAELSEITVATSLPGWTAEIRRGTSAEGPFDEVVAAAQTATATTTWQVEGGSGSYYVLWITAPAEEPGRDHAVVDGVTARS